MNRAFTLHDMIVAGVALAAGLAAGLVLRVALR